jgi:tetratricopeptide (TPR) repeat protein
LETEIKSKGPDPGIQEYKTALEQAWMDGLLTDMEKEMLKKLREKYSITDEIHTKLESRVKTDLGFDESGAVGGGDILFDIVDPTNEEESNDPGTEAYWINEGKKRWYSNAQSEEDRLESLAAFDKAIEMNPGNYIAWTYKGAINKKMGYSEEALACYDKAIELRNDFIACWYNKGVLLAQGSITKLEEAIQCFDEVLRLNPNNTLALRDREILLNLVTLSLEKKDGE